MFGTTLRSDHIFDYKSCLKKKKGRHICLLVNINYLNCQKEPIYSKKSTNPQFLHITTTPYANLILGGTAPLILTVQTINVNFTGMTSSTSQLCIDCCAQSVSLFFTVKTLRSCWQTLYLFIYHSSPSCWRLWPSRRQIKAVAQPPISSDIYKICTEQASQGARLSVLASCCHGAHGLETF